jgi:uncharacterized membrane protein
MFCEGGALTMYQQSVRQQQQQQQQQHHQQQNQHQHQHQHQQQQQQQQRLPLPMSPSNCIKVFKDGMGAMQRGYKASSLCQNQDLDGVRQDSCSPSPISTPSS